MVVWHYQHANTDNIRKTMHDLNWKRALGIKDDEMVKIFHETVSNTLINYVHHENVSFDDQDFVDWQQDQKTFTREKWIL